MRHYDYQSERESSVLYLVDKDLESADYVKKILDHARYRLRHFVDLSSLKEVLEQDEDPAVIIVSMNFPDGNSDIISFMNNIISMIPETISVLMISNCNDIELRLAAYRMGIRHWIEKPAGAIQLVNYLDKLTRNVSSQAYRVLLVDDDPVSLMINADILQLAGFEVLTEHKPLNTLEAVNKFLPEVLVLDVYMPDVNGSEIAAILHDDDRYDALPVIYLSSETNIDKQLQTLNQGGEHFLTKPVEPACLVTSVLAQARKYRENKKIRDSLRQTLYEQQCEHMALNQHAMVSVTDVMGNISYVNERFCTVSGFNGAELIGQNHRIVKSTVHPDEYFKEMWSTIAAGNVWHGEMCNCNRSKALYWLETTIVPFIDKNGKPYQYTSIHTDITKRKTIEKSLNHFKTTLDMTKDCVFMFDPVSLKFFYFNQGAIEQSGYSETELLDMTPADIEPGINPFQFHQLIAPLIKGKQKTIIFETIHRHKNGTELPVEMFIQYIDPEGEAARFVAIVRNITERIEDEVRQQGKNHILKLIAMDSPVSKVLDAIILHAETMLSDSSCSILLLDSSTKQLIISKAPGLLDFYNHCIDKIESGIGIGPCDEAAYSGERLIITDFSGYHNEGDFVRLAQQAGLHACWSEPVFSSQGVVLGTFTTYFSAKHEPDFFELKFAEELAQFVAIVLERDQSKQALISAKDEAEKANRTKSEFLSSMSHELRTPMNAILGFAQILEYDNDLDNDQQDNVYEILKAGEHLLNLINEVLDLAKIESGHIELSLEPVRLTPLVEECFTLLEPVAKKQGVSISHANMDTYSVRADRTRLKQVLLNLLTNAIKYNSEQGRVELTASESNDNEIRVMITDNGNGIADEQFKELFQPFSRLGAEASDIEGTGIGLAVTQKLIEMMGGRIGVDSQLDIGSCFWIELPIDTFSSAEDGNTAADCNTDKKLSGNPAVVTEQRHTILYIEDNPSNLKLVSRILAGQTQIKLITAHEPLLGLELASAHQPELILLDINMPHMDGYQVLSVLQSNKLLKSIPVIALTANAMVKDIERAKAAGFADYLSKPINVNEFLHTVDSFLLNHDNNMLC